MRDLSDQQFALILILPLLFFLSAIVIYPLVYSFWLSLNNVNYVAQQFAWAGISQYVKIFEDPLSAHYFAVTARFTVEVVLMSLGLSVGAALILNEAFRGRKFLRVAVLLPWAISEYSTAIMWRFLYSSDFGFFNSVLFSLGLTDHYIPIITPEISVELTALAFSWHFVPLLTFFILASLQTVPEVYYKAAKIDCAGMLKRFTAVTFPYIKYTLLICLTLATLEAARATDIILILTGGGPGLATTTVTYRIYLSTVRELNLGSGAALSYLLLIVVFVTTLVYFTLLTRKQKTEE